MLARSGQYMAPKGRLRPSDLLEAQPQGPPNTIGPSVLWGLSLSNLSC